MNKLDHLTHEFHNYLLRTQRSGNLLSTSVKVSTKEFIENIRALKNGPSTVKAAGLTRGLLGSSAWIGSSYLKYITTLTGLNKKIYGNLKDKDGQFIIDKVSRNIKLDPSQYPSEQIFQAIYNELEYSFQNPKYNCELKIPMIFPTVVLISGMLNEVYSTAAFERGVKHLEEISGIKYFVADTHGLKSSEYNVELIQETLFNYVEENPDEKLWIIAYSKGGIDSLRFLKDHKEWSSKNIVGLSTIASPILGSQHLEHDILKLLNSIHDLSQAKLYKLIDKKIDLLAKEFQKSVSQNHQGPWFQQNYGLLPDNIFYTSLALKAEWYESHIGMILAKIFFNSKNINDGVVDAQDAVFPKYFDSINLGIVNGHHLVGARSSTYIQEVLIISHIIILKYYNLV